jgi:hypothetical protein
MVQSMVWQQKLRACPYRPRGRQRRQFDALVTLAELLNWPTGTGFASVGQIAKGADVSESTAKRATAWAQEAGWLRKKTRGHNVGDGTDSANEWVLLLPDSQQVNSGEAQQVNSQSQQVTTVDRPSESTPPRAAPAGSLMRPAATPTDAAGVIRSETDATAAEAAAIAAEWAARPGIRSTAAVLGSKTADELRAEVRRHREASKPTQIPPGPPPNVHRLRETRRAPVRRAG